MALGVAYRCEFTDILGIDCKIEIKKDPAPGSVITLQASGSPASIEWYGSDNIFDQHIMGSMLTLNVEAGSDFALSALFTSDHLEYPVTLSFGVTEFWHGYILMDNYQEPYDKAPFSISLTATDGLGLLKDFKFEDLAYTERQITSVVIHDILALVGIDTFTEYINLYESTMDSDVGDSVLDQSGVDPYLFTENNCYEALEIILKSLNAGIKQDQGAFIIYRFKEVKNATMYGRTYTDGTTKSATTKTSAQYINRPTQSSSFHDYEGGNMLLIPQCKMLYANQDFGIKKSILLNYNFLAETFSAASPYTVDHWTLNGTTTINKFSNVYQGNGEEGVYIIECDTVANTYYLSQNLPVIETTDAFIMKFNVSGVGLASGEIHAFVSADDGVDTQYFDGSGWVVTAGSFIVHEKVTPDTYGVKPDVVEVIFPVYGIPYSGTLRVRLYAGVSAGTNLNAIFKTVEFYFVADDGLSVEGIGYTVGGATTGQIIENEYLLGDGYGFDNDHLNYEGTFNVWDSTDPLSTSLSWHTRGATENKALIEVISSEMAAQFTRPKQLIDLPLREMSNSFLSLTGNLQDVLNQTGGNNRVFAINSGVFNVRDREWNLVLNEII